MSSSQFVLAYACNRELGMTAEELTCRIESATEHVRTLHAVEIVTTRVGDERSGFIVWRPANGGPTWPAAVSTSDEGAAWLHVPVAAKSRADGVDPLRLARDVTTGRLDRSEMGSPAAAAHWSHDGLRIVNDRLGMVRLYEFEIPDFGMVWSSRPGLAHIFSGILPRFEQSTWSGMATLGWNAEGRAHLGNGRQMPASVTIFVDPSGRTTRSSDRDEWIRASLSGEIPPLAEAAEGMVHALQIASWWPKIPVADLSGGKDSRVTAAAAISAGVVDVVRTVNTDTGEVDVARELLRLVGDPVEHRIDEVVQPSGPSGRIFDRYLSMQRAWEGAYNARSAYRSHQFRGFRPAGAPRINGLGGEAVQGRTLLSPAWETKMEGAGVDVGRDRLVAMTRSGAVATTENVIADAIRSVDSFVDEASGIGLDTSFMAVDFFYHFSKMPYWSMPQANPSTLLPFYSPEMLPRTMWSLAHASVEYGKLHRDVLRAITPEWADVPFYKGSAKTRATPWMWENADWPELSSAILDGREALDTFSDDAIEKVVAQGNTGTGSVKTELALTRAMWELSFRRFAEEVAQAAERTAAAVSRIRAERHQT